MVFYDGKEENHIIVNGGVPSSYMKKELKSGANGTCYITESGEVFKKTRIRPEYFSDYVGVAKLESPFFAFPKVSFYEGKRSGETLQGYTMDYVNGTDIRQLDPTADIKDLISALERLETEMIRLTREEYLRFFDLNYGNLLYQQDKKDFKVVDTDLYYFEIHEEYPDVLKANIQELAEYILYYMLGHYSKYVRCVDPNVYTTFERAISSGKARPSTVLRCALEAIEREMKEEIKSIGEFKSGLELIKR